MTFSFDWILAGFVFVLANLYLGIQLVRLIWPLRALKLSARLRKESVDAASWLSLATDEFEVRSAIPVKLVVFLLQRGDLRDPAELRCRSLWRRGWIYTILTLILFYARPYLFGTSMDSSSARAWIRSPSRSSSVRRSRPSPRRSSFNPSRIYGASRSCSTSIRKTAALGERNKWNKRIRLRTHRRTMTRSGESSKSLPAFFAFC